MNSRGQRLGLVLLASVLLLAPHAPAAGSARVDATVALERSEAAVGRRVADHGLVAADGSRLRTADFRGRPLVLSFVYTSCSSVCPITTQSLKRAVAEARSALGRDAFAVLTVGFDAPRDSPARLAAFAADQDIDGDPSWRVASGDAASIARLLDDVGFTYSAAAGGFEHVAQVTILDAEGRIYRQVYGDTFPVQLVVEPLKELVFGTTTRSISISDLIDRVRFLCTVYDPRSGRYKTDYTIFGGMALGAISLVVMAWVIVGLWRGSRRPAGLPAGQSK